MHIKNLKKSRTQHIKNKKEYKKTKTDLKNVQTLYMEEYTSTIKKKRKNYKIKIYIKMDENKNIKEEYKKDDKKEYKKV